MSDLPTDAPRITREIRQRLRWVTDTGGARTYPRAYFWRVSVQAMFALGLATHYARGSKYIVLEITDLGRRALALADAAASRSASVAGTPRTKGPWA